MRISRMILLGDLSLAPLTGTALAQGAPTDPATTVTPSAGHARHALRDKIDTANTTHDGHLTRAQAQAGELRMVAHKFDTINAGHNGFVTLADIRDFVQARHAARQQAGAPETPQPQ